MQLHVNKKYKIEGQLKHLKNQIYDVYILCKEIYFIKESLLCMLLIFCSN